MMKTFEELIQELPLDLVQEAEDYARFTLEKNVRKHESEHRPNGTEVARDQRAQYTPELGQAANQYIKTLPELVRALPLEAQQEVRDFIEFLLDKRQKKLRGKPTFEWAGALKDMRDQYTSVELQHKISDWRARG